MILRRNNSVMGLMIILLICLIITNQSKWFFISQQSIKNDHGRYIETAQGIASYEKLLREVYRPLGFMIANFDYIFPQLRSIQPWKCNQTFFTPLSVRSASDTNEMLMRLRINYTLNGHAKLESRNPDGTTTTRNRPTENVHEGQITQANSHLLRFSELLHATGYENIRNKTGLIFGPFENRIQNEEPLTEIICLHNGAAKFDFAVMHSVVEYLGFGRFDDIIDPFADIREVRKAYCSLKMGGLLFLGIPVCVDSVYYPVKRCYGRIRLPLITQGFKVLYYFENNKPTPNNLSVSLFQSKERYVMFVLKKS